MKKYFFLLSLFWALPSLAAQPIYGSFMGQIDNTIVVSYKTLSETENFACNLDRWQCDAIKSSADYLSQQKTTDVVTPPAPFLRPGTAQVTRSDDGRFIAWYEPASGTKTIRRYGLHDTQTGQDYHFATPVKYWDLISEEFRVFAFSPDGKRLLYLDDQSGYPTLHTVNLTKPLSDIGFKGTRLISRKYSIADFIFTSTSSIAFLANREHPLKWGLYLYNLETGSLKQLALNATYTGRMRLFKTKLLFYLQSGNLVGPAIYDLSASQTRPLPVNLGKLKITAASPPGQVVNLRGVSGIVSRPAASGKFPMIVWLHGGPYRQTNLGYHSWSSYGSYDWLLESLRLQGFGIAKIDYAGSYGYGRNYAESIKNQVGVKDVDSVAIAVAQLKKIYPVSQVYLMGNSYGGYLGLKTLVEYPKSFRGAVSIAGVTDWQALHEKLPQSIFTIHFNGLPTAVNRAQYDRASIINKISRLTDQKILLLHGQQDGTIPVDQADLLYRTVSKNIEFIAYPDEDHVFSEEATLEDMCRQILTLTGKGLAGRCLQ